MVADSARMVNRRTNQSKSKYERGVRRCSNRFVGEDKLVVKSKPRSETGNEKADYYFSDGDAGFGCLDNSGTSVRFQLKPTIL